MAIALVQVKTNTGTTGSPNLTLTSASTAGNLLVAMLDTGQNSGNPTFAAPAGWTALTELTNQTFIFRNGQLFYYTNNPGSISSITFTATPAISGGWCLYVFEFSGVATTAPLDQEAQHVNLSGQGSATPSETITTAAAGDLVLGWAAGDAANGASGVTGPAAPWINQASIADVGGFERAIASYQIQSSAGAITYQPTFAGVTDYIIAIISFKAASGGSTPVSVAESMAATDAVSVQASTTIADTLSATDALASLQASLTVADTLSATDALAAGLTVSLSIPETLAATDALSTTVRLTVTDTVAATDGATLNTPVSIADSLVATDAVTVTVNLTVPDTLAATDLLASLTASFSVADSVLASDALLLQASLTVADSVLASDAVSVANVVPAGLAPVTIPPLRARDGKQALTARAGTTLVLRARDGKQPLTTR